MSRKSKNHSYQPEKDVHRITLYNTVYPEHQHKSIKERLYLHFDFACFYAQVEQLRKDVYGFPVIVGGWRKDNGQVKGIVATSSYEARAYGVKTGMSAFEASKLCPCLIMFQVDYETYTSISKQVHKIMKRYAPTIERYSMDEYFIDITFLKDKPRKEITAFAKRLQDEIFDVTGLVGTIGIGRSKTYSKLASDFNKPDGITLILTDEEKKSMIYPLEVNEVWGVGARRYEHLLSEGYKTIGDVAERGNEKTFIRLFGENFGKMLFQTIIGKDQGRVLEEISENYQPKQGISFGHTFSEGSKDVEEIKGEFAIAVQKVCYRMRAHGIKASSFTGAFGFNSQDLSTVGFRFVMDGFTNLDGYIYKALIDKILPAIVKATEKGLEIRNIILATDKIDKTNQADIFFQESDAEKARFKAVDEIKNRFGQEYITKANTMIRVRGNTHFFERNI